MNRREKEEYLREYSILKSQGKPFFPYAVAKDGAMACVVLLVIILILLLIGALPAWPYSANWGYYPSGGLGIVLLILIVVALVR